MLQTFLKNSFLLPLALCLALTACVTTNEVSGRNQFIIYSAEQDVPMGVQAMEEIKKNNEVVTSGPYAERVERIGMRIAAVSDRPDFPWEFIAIKSDQMNAFALPGGQAAVYTKMLDSFTDEELAAVMGHEIAHAVLRHGMEQVSRGQAQGAFVGILGAVIGGGEDNNDTREGALQLAALASAVGVSLPHSRKMELEADDIGTLYMAKAGYDPRKAIALWKKMSELSAGGQKPPRWLSTHPTDTKRIKRLEDKMDDYMTVYNANR